MAACECSSGNSNTGIVSCKAMMSVTRKLIVVQKYDSTGARNGIDVSGVTTLDQAYVTALINQTDATKRWFPLPKVDNVEDTKGDSKTETANSDEVFFISEGARTFTGVMFKETPQSLAQVKAMRCVDNAVFIVDRLGNLIGELSDDLKTLYPVDVNSATWNASLVKTTDSTVQKIQLDFNYSIDVQDENLNFITQSEFDGVDFLSANGLLDVIASPATAVPSAMIAALTYLYGTAVTRSKVKGLVMADFAIYNNTTSATVTLVSVSEVDGVYTLIYSAGVSEGDVLHLSITADGYTNEKLADITVVAA